MLDSDRRLWRWNPRLQVAHQRAEGRPVVVLHDPSTDSYYQLGTDEYAVAQVFDGARDLAAARAQAASQGTVLAAGELEDFVTQLVDAGLLEPVSESAASRLDPGPSAADLAPEPTAALDLQDLGPSPAVQAPPATVTAPPATEASTPVVPGPARGGPSRLFELDVAAFAAGDFFARGIRWVRPFFAVPALWAAAGAIGLAAGITAVHAGELQESLRGILTSGSILALWILFAIVVILHEMAHGFACAHFGRRVGALGFLLLYGRPCAYCDVSDAWMLPKAQRLWIMAAGSLLELTLWALATLLWRVAAPETLLHRGALLLLVLTGFGSLLNFNPLIRFDGYYMLSDGLEIPNLRSRALDDLKRRLLGRPPLTTSQRERRIFLAYSLVAVTYSVLLVLFLVLRAQRFVATRWGGPGLVVLWGAVLLFAARPAHGFFTDWKTAINATSRRRFVWTVASAALVAVLVFGHWPLKVASECRVEPRARVVLRSPLQGTVEAVYAQEAEEVRAGTPIVQLATRELDFSLESARAEVDELKAKLALLEIGPRREEIELAERRLAEAGTRVRFQRKEHERAQASLASDLVSRQSVDSAEQELRLSEDEEAAARKTLDLQRAGARPEELRAMQARLDVMQAQVARLEDERQRTRVLAPIDGQVLTIHPERLVSRYVERGDSLLLLADLRTMQVEIPVPEKEVGDVVQGALVRFKSRSLPGRTFEGRVLGIAAAAESGTRQRIVLVRSEFDNQDGALRPGTTGYAKIYCGERRLIGLLAHRGLRSLRTEFWALW